MRRAVIVGSFDPFTVGHHDMVERTLGIFDQVVIGVVGDNVNKPGLSPASERVAAIRRVYADEQRVTVATYHGLAVDFCLEQGGCCLVKGVRSVRDYEYELEQADINRSLTQGRVETLLLPARPCLAHVSSSMVRELRHFGRDVTPWTEIIPERRNGGTTESATLPHCHKS